MRAVEPLVKALNHKNFDVRRGAAEALGDIGDTRAVEPLIAVVNNSFEYSTVRGEAIKALAKMGDTRAVRSLVTILTAVFKCVRPKCIIVACCHIQKN